MISLAPVCFECPHTGVNHCDSGTSGSKRPTSLQGVGRRGTLGTRLSQDQSQSVQEKQGDRHDSELQPVPVSRKTTNSEFSVPAGNSSCLADINNTHIRIIYIVFFPLRTNKIICIYTLVEVGSSFGKLT